MLFFFFIIIITVIIIRLQSLVYLISYFFFSSVCISFASPFNTSIRLHVYKLLLCIHNGIQRMAPRATIEWHLNESGLIIHWLSKHQIPLKLCACIRARACVCVCLYIEPYELCTKWEYGMMSRLPIRQAHNRIWFSSLYTDCQLVCFANENRLRWRRRQH